MSPSSPRTLAVDVGGTGLKMLVLDAAGAPLTERTRVPTPRPATPDAVIDALVALAGGHGLFDRVSVGFPGVVVDGCTLNAPNLHDDWAGVGLAQRISDRLSVPVRVANDADVQGLGVIEGRGVELVLTLGTGVGSSLFVDGRLVPNVELGHHPFRQDETYEEQLGKAALLEIGKRRWNRRLSRAISRLARVFNFRRLYLGGGHARKVRVELPDNVVLVPNVAGLLGGIALWR